MKRLFCAIQLIQNAIRDVGDYVIVKCVADTSSFDLTHYMVFKDGEATIYMGTYTVSEPSIGEVSASI